MIEEELKYMMEELRTASSDRVAELIFNRIYEKFKSVFKHISISLMNEYLRSYQIDLDEIVYPAFLFLWDKRHSEELRKIDGLIPYLSTIMKNKILDEQRRIKRKPRYQLYDPTKKYTVPSYYDEEKEIPVALIQYPNQEYKLELEEIIMMVSDQLRHPYLKERDRKILKKYWNLIRSPKRYGLTSSERSTLSKDLHWLNRRLKSKLTPFKNFETLFEAISYNSSLAESLRTQLELGSTISLNTIRNIEVLIRNQFGSDLKWVSINRAIWGRLMYFETLDLIHAYEIAKSSYSTKIDDVLALLGLLSNPSFNILKQVYYRKNSKPNKEYIPSNEVAQKMEDWQGSKIMSDTEWKDWSTSVMIGWEKGNIDSMQKQEATLN